MTPAPFECHICGGSGWESEAIADEHGVIREHTVECQCQATDLRETDDDVRETAQLIARSPAPSVLEEMTRDAAVRALRSRLAGRGA